MKKLFDPFMIVYGLLWLVIHFFRWVQAPLPWANSYVTDMVFVPVVAHAALCFIRRFVVCNRDYHFPLSYILLIAIYTSVVFEWVMPAFSKVYTRDTGDVVAYFAGSLFYYFVHQKRPGNTQSENSNRHPEHTVTR